MRVAPLSILFRSCVGGTITRTYDGLDRLTQEVARRGRELPCDAVRRPAL